MLIKKKKLDEEITYGHCDVCPYLRFDWATHYILAYRYAKLKYIIM